MGQLPSVSEVKSNVLRDPAVSILNHQLIDQNGLIDLASKVVDKDYHFHPIPANEVRKYNFDTINYFMQVAGIYTFPTMELIDWLNDQVDEVYEDTITPAIEIGCGNGWIGRSLEIPFSDSRVHDKLEIKMMMESCGCIPIQYPDDVKTLEASDAIRMYHPEYIIASYPVAKFIPGSDYGSVYGIDQQFVSTHCHKYFFIGNKRVHSRDPLMKRKHQEIELDGLITRGDNSQARIFIFENKQWMP